MTLRRGPRDDAGQRRLPAHRPGRGHPERMRSAPRGGQLPKALISPPLGTAQAQTGPKREKWARLRLIRDAPLVPLSCLVFPFRGDSLGPPLSPVSSVPGFAFRGSGGPPVVWLGFAPRDLAPARVNHDDVEAPPPFPVWDDLPRGANRAPVDFA